MQDAVNRTWQFAVDNFPTVIVPIIILIVGFVVALLLSALVRRGLRRTQLDERLAARMLGKKRGAEINTERWAGRIVYYTVLLITAIAFLQAIELTAATEPLNVMLSALLGFVPNLIGAALIAFVAWVLASLTRAILVRALRRWDVDRRLRRSLSEEEEAARAAAVSTPAGEAHAEAAEPGQAAARVEEPATVQRAIADAAYWLVWLLFLPALLGALELEGLLAPVESMLDRILAFAPNVASALIIAGIGWLTARIVQRLVTNVLAGIGTDRLSERVGLSRALGKSTLSALIGLVVYIVILIPVAVAALNALQLESITAPASTMLERFFVAVPAIFGAAILIGLAYVVARLLYGLIENLLDGVGFNRVLTKIGFSSEQIGERSPSQIVAGLAMIAVVYFAVTEAARLLGFEAFAALAVEFAVLAGHVLLGLVIFGFGLYLAKLAADAIERSDVGQARVLAIVTKAAVLTLAGAMALRQMGIADEIIEVAFTLVLGAVAVAAALAFGLGGRDAASKTIEDIREHIKEHPPYSPGYGTGAGHAGPAGPSASITDEEPPAGEEPPI